MRGTTCPQLKRRIRSGGTWGNSCCCRDAMGARVPDARITLRAGARTCKDTFRASCLASGAHTVLLHR